MPDPRKDNRNRAPQSAHRAVFMGGWTDAVSGTLYESVTKRKTQANIGNIFGWIFGQKDEEFKKYIWELYLENALEINENEE